MKFGRFPLDLLDGAVLAHAQKLPDGRIPKGTILRRTEVDRLAASGIDSVVAAILESGDVVEDVAAGEIGRALGRPHIRVDRAATGRVNLFAEANGLFVPDRASVDRLNRIDAGITLATLGAYTPVVAGAMVATVKIIPLAVAGPAVEEAVALAADAAVLALHPFIPRRVRLIQTELSSIKSSVLDKTARVTADRLAASGSVIAIERRVAHDASALAAVLSEPSDDALTIVFGASAVIDPADVIPAAIALAGGTVDHIGMPVDPGNLLLLGALGGRPIVGAPGCARSRKENGFDWVLARLLANVPIGARDITGLGVGGLLTEIASRPQPRQQTEHAAVASPTRVNAVVLAAGSSRRMAGPNKLLATFDGVSLIRRSVSAAIGSAAARVIVVVGNDSADVCQALTGIDVEIVRNQRAADGISSSVQAGFERAEIGADGVLIMVADQPFLGAADLNRLIAAFEPGIAVVAEAEGVRGNPAILPVSLRPAVARLHGDVGARRLLDQPGIDVRTVSLNPRALVDVDTPDALRQAGGVLPR